MRLFTRKQERHTAAAPETPTCLHVGMTARWDSVEDMGNEAKATSFVCATCGATFTPEKAAEIRGAQAEQIRRDLG